MEIRQVENYLRIFQGPTEYPKEFKLMVAEQALAWLNANPSPNGLKGKAKELEDVAIGIKAEALRCQRVFCL